MGEDYEGEVAEEEASYAGDAEVGPRMETGMTALVLALLRDSEADYRYSWVMDAVGRSGRNSGCTECQMLAIQWHLIH